MKNLFFVFLALCFFSGQAQKLTVEKSTVTFFSDGAIEDITATNSKSSGIWIKDSGQIAFAIPIMDFKFVKKLMQEHFNEKYMESEKFPRATFEGTVLKFKATAKGPQTVLAKGKLTIHGITREVELPGTAEVMPDKKISVKSTFMVKLADHNIAIPQLLWQNIAEQVEVKVEFTFK